MDGVLSQEEINALLNNPGASSDTADGQLSDSEKDTIGEIANISMGTAATTLFSLVNRKVEISTPVVTMANWDGVRKACHCDGGIQFAFRDPCRQECFGRNSLGLDCDRLRNSRLVEHFGDSVVEICRGLAPLVVFVFHRALLFLDSRGLVV